MSDVYHHHLCDQEGGGGIRTKKNVGSSALHNSGLALI